MEDRVPTTNKSPDLKESSSPDFTDREHRSRRIAFRMMVANPASKIEHPNPANRRVTKGVRAAAVYRRLRENGISIMGLDSTQYKRIRGPKVSDSGF